MKKIAICLLATCLSLTLLPLNSSAATVTPATSIPAPTPAETAEAKTLNLRLNEINMMDKSNLKSADKKELRKEVRSINHKLREISGGVYLSVSAIILIMILLVIFL
jgi:hypothetical protein